MSKTDNVCDNCGIRRTGHSSSKKNKQGKLIRYHRRICNTCRKYPNLQDKAKQSTCRGCGKEYPAVCLDVDHISGDKNDNRYQNLQILCANCHRMKSHLCGDHIRKDLK